jgi:hypothetical protein
MSAIRGTTSASPRCSARRSALDSAFSSALMGRRWLTPLRLSIFLSRRAANATPSATSRMKRGMRTPLPRSVQASCCVIATPCSTVPG